MNKEGRKKQARSNKQHGNMDHRPSAMTFLILTTLPPPMSTSWPTNLLPPSPSPPPPPPPLR